MGDGVGKGTNIALFLTIMKGPYDAVLPWPFKEKITFQLINQNDPVKRASWRLSDPIHRVHPSRDPQLRRTSAQDALSLPRSRPLRIPRRAISKSSPRPSQVERMPRGSDDTEFHAKSNKQIQNNGSDDKFL